MSEKIVIEVTKEVSCGEDECDGCEKTIRNGSPVWWVEGFACGFILCDACKKGCPKPKGEVKG